MKLKNLSLIVNNIFKSYNISETEKIRNIKKLTIQTSPTFHRMAYFGKRQGMNGKAQNSSDRMQL